MAVDWTNLKAMLNTRYESDADVEHCWDFAVVLVDKYCGASPVPQVVKEEAYLLVGAEMWDRRKAPENPGQVSPEGDVSVRLSRDPLTPAFPILERWVVRF